MSLLENKEHLKGVVIRVLQSNTSKETALGKKPEHEVHLASEPGPGDFPLRAVVILMLAMTITAYTLCNVFPYIGMMVKNLLGLETTNEAGYYAGYMASSFTFGRFLSGYFWGRVSDAVGRKPVIIIGLLAITVLSLVFGLSTSLTMAISSRFVMGLVNGSVPALRTTLREICGPEHVVRGMSFFSGCKAISLVIGTGVGGLLAMPAVHYPRWFSAAGVFGRHPFFLPNLVGAVSSILVLLLVIVYLPETKGYQDQRAKRERARHAHDLTVNTEGNTDGGHDEILAQESKTSSLWGPDGLLAIPNVKILLFMACVSQFVMIGFEEAYPLWAVSTPDAGGLGWGTIEIGQVLLSSGVAMTVVNFIVLPPLIERLGIARWQRIGGFLSVPAYVFVPCAKIFSWNETSLFLALAASITLVYTCALANTLALAVASTSIVPPHMRGALGGLYNTFESLGRFIGPAGYATTFAWSIAPSSCQWVNYSFVFYTSAAILGVIAGLAMQTFTLETLTKPAQHSQPRRRLHSRPTAAGAVGGATEETALRSHTVPILPLSGGNIEPV